MDAALDGSGILLSTFSGAMVVISGGFYALLFALGRINNHRLSSRLSLLSYVLLVLFTYLLSRSLALQGFWVFVIAVMLVGYFFAPRAVWHLCVGTHEQTGHADKSNVSGAAR